MVAPSAKPERRDAAMAPVMRSPTTTTTSAMAATVEVDDEAIDQELGF